MMTPTKKEINETMGTAPLWALAALWISVPGSAKRAEMTPSKGARITR